MEMGTIGTKVSRSHREIIALLSLTYKEIARLLTTENIRIYHECEGRIEKSVTRNAVWHHEACQVMTKVIPRDGFFYLTLTRIMDSFSCSPLFVCLLTLK